MATPAIRPGCFAHRGRRALEHLERDGQLLPITSTGAARWCVRPRVITQGAGPTDLDSVFDEQRDPRVDGPSLAWAVKVLEQRPWREGYATLVKLAAHERRIGGRATAGRRPPHHDAGLDEVDFSPRECAAILRSTRDPADAREFVRFLIETREMEAAPTPSGDGSARDRDVESLVGDLLGATLVDAQDELWAAWRALEEAGSPEPAHKWLIEPPPWPPASIEKYLKREGERAMSLIETLAGELSPRPGGPRLADPELAQVAAGGGQNLLAEMAHAADGALVHEPRFRSWLRAEWTASARQRYRRVAKLAATAQASTAVRLKGHLLRHDPRHPGRTGETLRHDRRGRRRIARAPAGRDDVRSGPGRRGQDDAGSPGDGARNGGRWRDLFR